MLFTVQATTVISKAAEIAASEKVLNTTQGRLGMEGKDHDDQTNNGCAVMALMITILSLLGCASCRAAETVIDTFSREPLRRIREQFYPGQGHALVDLVEAEDELCKRNLMLRPDVGIYFHCVVVKRFN